MDTLDTFIPSLGQSVDSCVGTIVQSTTPFSIYSNAYGMVRTECPHMRLSINTDRSTNAAISSSIGLVRNCAREWADDSVGSLYVM